MDEIKVEGKSLPRYRLFLSDAKRQPIIGEAACESDHLDDIRVFRRNAGRRYVLLEYGNRIPLVNLDVPVLTDVRSAAHTSDGNGWYCENTKCGNLIAAEEIKSFGAETLLRITCPHCSEHNYYRCSDYGWKKSRG